MSLSLHSLWHEDILTKWLTKCVIAVNLCTSYAHRVSKTLNTSLAMKNLHDIFSLLYWFYFTFQVKGSASNRKIQITFWYGQLKMCRKKSRQLLVMFLQLSSLQNFLLILTVNLEHMLWPSLSVQIILALGDDYHWAPLLLQTSFALCNGQMDGAGLLIQHKLSPVVIKFPDPRRVAREGLWRSKVLWGGRSAWTSLKNGAQREECCNQTKLLWLNVPGNATSSTSHVLPWKSVCHSLHSHLLRWWLLCSWL